MENFLSEKNINGVLNVYKPLGITSNGVVTKIRRLTGIKKVGHTGTLDPEAEGVLPICIGKGTKVAGMLTDSNKAYRATIRLGITTDSQDMTGNVVSENEVNVSREEFEKAIMSFVGEISQIPPMYSAIKQNGQPLYKLARKGVEVERKPRIITIFKIEMVEFSGETAVFDVYCSKGTYIRTLCADIGEKLGCGAAMEALVRIKSGCFEISEAVTLEYLEEHPEEIKKLVTPPERLFDYPEYKATVKETEKIRNGIALNAENMEEGTTYKVFSADGEFLCISQVTEGSLKMLQSFYGGGEG